MSYFFSGFPFDKCAFYGRLTISGFFYEYLMSRGFYDNGWTMYINEVQSSARRRKWTWFFFRCTELSRSERVALCGQLAATAKYSVYRVMIRWLQFWPPWVYILRSSSHEWRLQAHMCLACTLRNGGTPPMDNTLRQLHPIVTSSLPLFFALLANTPEAHTYAMHVDDSIML